MSHHEKIADRRRLERQAAEWRRQGEGIVTTNGCFDILHAGHLTTLQAARELGDRLVVGINSDASVAALKPGRPLVPAADRAAALAALPFVDLVSIFEETTPEELLRVVRPHVHVKGGDYEAAAMPETPVVRAGGGEVVILPLVGGFNTSRLLDAYRRRLERALEPGAPPAAAD